MGQGANLNFLTDANSDLKSKLNETEKVLKELQLQSSIALKDFNEKLRVVTNSKNELTLNLSSIKHSAELAEARFANAHKSLENAREEINQYKKTLNSGRIKHRSKNIHLLVNLMN